MGCLTFVISVTRSAASSSRCGASRPVMTTCCRAGPVGEDLDHLVDVDPAPLQRIGELVEHVEVVALLGQPARDLGPALGGGRGVVDLDPGLRDHDQPGAHLVPLHGTAGAVLVVQAAEFAKGGLLAHLPLRALDELEDADVEALVPRAQGHPERGGGLALAGPVWTASNGALRRARVVRPSAGTATGWPCGIERLLRRESGRAVAGVRPNQPRQTVGAQVRQPNRRGAELGGQHLGQTQTYIGGLAVDHDRRRALGDAASPRRCGPARADRVHPSPGRR